MVRKKSTLSKVKKRKEAYKRQLKPDAIPSHCVDFVNKDMQAMSSDVIKVKEQFDDYKIIKDIIKKIVSKVSRLDNERKRQLQIRKQNKMSEATISNEISIVKHTRQKVWFRKKYCNNILFREQKNERVTKYFRNKYHNNNDFREKQKARVQTHILVKYRNNTNFRAENNERAKIHILNKYYNNTSFRNEVKSKAKRSFLNKYYNNTKFRNEVKSKAKRSFLNKYYNNTKFRNEVKSKAKISFLNKYYNNTNFRNEVKLKAKRSFLNKYYNNTKFRNEVKSKANIHILNKYHNNTKFRDEYKARMNMQVSKKYKSNKSIRLKMIHSALNWYQNNNTLIRKNSRRLYNQRRRILKKYTVIQSHKCAVKHQNLYMNNLNRFRKIIREGPDYVCLSCGLALFRNQVMPFVEQKYIKESMSYEIKKRIQSYFNYSLLRERKWICKSCSDKIKKRQMPSRAVVNKLKVCDVPSELKKLNNLEKHLIALRLPFMKIVNLTSGKLSSRLSQKGTKGPLHCVPSDVQDTVTILPRPVDKSMMVRLQLKRRIKYKAVWEEQLINPNDVRDALFVLTKMHPAYKSIKINEIHENYLTSDQEKNYDNNVELVVEPMDVGTISEETVIEQTEISNENNLKRLALGDIDNTFDSDEEINEDEQDIRTKYNIGTDSCTQPCDFNDFLVFDKEPCVVAPAEKNKLSSLLTDKTIEALAFPHLFPDGQGSYDEDRQTILRWKEYCKARLFSSDSRF
ncbi:unnamed protein product, partial [Rotaria sp. Silwood1]